jgi:hypothetical protein
MRQLENATLTAGNKNKAPWKKESVCQRGATQHTAQKYTVKRREFFHKI